MSELSFIFIYNLSVCLCQVSEWVWSHDNSSSVVGFSQWKPVVYQKIQPAIEDAAPCSHSEPVDLPQAPPSRIILAYFTQSSLTHGLNVTFNVTSEPAKNSTQYLSWWVSTHIYEQLGPFISPIIKTIILIKRKEVYWLSVMFSNV